MFDLDVFMLTEHFRSLLLVLSVGNQGQNSPLLHHWLDLADWKLDHHALGQLWVRQLAAIYDWDR